MPLLPARDAREFESLASFLRYILHKSTLTTIVVCSSRGDFLQRLLNECCRSSSLSPGHDEPHTCGSPHSDLLVPTLHLLSQSRSINLIFAPMVMHLRAVLSDIDRFKSTDKTVSNPEDAQKARTLAIVNPLAVHALSSDYSAQGLSRTLALATETASGTSMDLLVVETRSYSAIDGLGADEGEDRRRKGAWDVQLPLLNGSVRSGGGERTWAGRTIDLAAVVKTWCRLVPFQEDA